MRDEDHRCPRGVAERTDRQRPVDGQGVATPELGISLSEAVKERFPYFPGVGEFVSVPGNRMKR